MVLEHNISTMVMLSADCAWNYWEEEKEAKFGAIIVKLNSTEKLPCYVKREFSIFNEKVRRELGRIVKRTLTLFKFLCTQSQTEDEANLTHFAYNSWTGNDPGEVPSKSHGLIGLVEREWLDTVAVLDKDHIDYTDYVDAASMLAEELKKNKGR